MMKTFTNIALLFATLVLFQSCNNDDDYTPQPLPYFFCKINEQNFSRRPSLPCQSMVFSYYPNGINGIDSGYCVLSGTDCQLFKSVGIRIFNFSPTTDTINFLQSSFASSVSPYFSFEDQSIGEIQVVDSLISGFLKFDSFSDKQGDQNGIVSGTFGFIVTNEYLDTTIVVTEGRFQYIIDYEWY